MSNVFRSRMAMTFAVPHLPAFVCKNLDGNALNLHFRTPIPRLLPRLDLRSYLQAG